MWIESDKGRHVQRLLAFALSSTVHMTPSMTFTLRQMVLARVMVIVIDIFHEFPGHINVATDTMDGTINIVSCIQLKVSSHDH